MSVPTVLLVLHAVAAVVVGPMLLVGGGRRALRAHLQRRHDGRAPREGPPEVDLRWLRAAAVVEGATLLLLLLNLATVHLRVVTEVVGPVHGVAWLATVAAACLAPVPVAARVLSTVPGVGGLLALAHTRSRR